MAGENDVKKVAELEGQVADLEAQLDKLAKMIEAAGKDNPDLGKALELQKETLAKVEELTTALEKATVDKEAVEKELKLAKEMTDREREFTKEWPPEKKDTFFGKPKKDREDVMDEEDKKKEKSDETVTISGQTIKKSAVGAESFAIMKAQAEEIEKNSKTIAAEIEKRENAEFQKRADDEFPHVPGTVEERAKILREISKMDEPVRKSFESVLTASEKLAKAGFATLGSGGGKNDPEGKIAKQAADFTTKVDEIATREKCSKTQALSKARHAHPELFKAYQEQEADTSAN